MDFQEGGYVIPLSLVGFTDINKQLMEQPTDGPTILRKQPTNRAINQRTDRQTNEPYFRDTWMHLEKIKL